MARYRLASFVAFMILTSLAPTSAQAEPAVEVIFDSETHSTLDAFKLYLETPEETSKRPGILLLNGVIAGRAGDGNFTAYKFADVGGEDFTLRVIFEIPSGIRYSNSGIYLLYGNPQTTSAEFASALSKASARRKLFGAGPFELDFFSHEVQIISGSDATVPLENHGAGAFYGVDVGENVGQQQILSPYELRMGDTYELTLISRGEYRRVFLRATEHQKEAVLVSEMTNLSRALDPVRGGAPQALLLQGFYNNGRDVQLPKFRRITLQRQSLEH